MASVRRIYEYYKKYRDYQTDHGRELPQGRQIVDLAGCDLLTIGPDLLSQFQKREGKLWSAKLVVDVAKAKDIPRVTLDEDDYPSTTRTRWPSRS